MRVQVVRADRRARRVVALQRHLRARLHLAADGQAQRVHRLEHDARLAAEPGAAILLGREARLGRRRAVVRVVAVEAVVVREDPREEPRAARERRLEAQLEQAARVLPARARVAEARAERARRDALIAVRDEPLQGERLPPRAAVERRRLEGVEAARRADVGDRHVAPARARDREARPHATVPAEVEREAPARAGDRVFIRREPHPAARRLVARARDQVDDAADRARAVEHRARAAHDLDALDVAEVDAPVVARVGLVEDVVVEHGAVLQDQQAIAVVVRLPEPAHRDGAVGRVERQRHPARAAERLGDGRIAKRLELLRGEHAERRGRVLERLRQARGGRHLAERHELEPAQIRLRALAHLDRPLDGLVAAQRHAHDARADRHRRHDDRREADGLAVDLDERVRLVGLDHR